MATKSLTPAAIQPETTVRLKKVYIVARRHSGTTFTDVLIGNAPGVESVGEIVTGLTFRREEPCSCGKLIEECPYWTSVAEIYEQRTGRSLFEDGEWLYWKSDIRNFFKVWFANLNQESEWRRYIEINDALLGAVQEQAEKATIVDSSKEFTRCLLTMRGDDDAVAIHMFRDPASIVGSHYYRLDQGMTFKFMKRPVKVGRLGRLPVMAFVAMTWNVGMVLACLLSWRFPGRVLHLSYEKLCENPNREFARIGRFLDVDLSLVSDGVAAGQEFPVGHNIGGNELRHSGTFRFIPNVKGRRKIPLIYRIVSHVAAAPGYLLRAMFIKY